jgi:hypothetical protein
MRLKLIFERSSLKENPGVDEEGATRFFQGENKVFTSWGTEKK